MSQKRKKSVFVVVFMKTLLHEEKFEIEFNTSHIQSINWYYKIPFVIFKV